MKAKQTLIALLAAVVTFTAAITARAQTNEGHASGTHFYKDPANHANETSLVVDGDNHKITAVRSPTNPKLNTNNRVVQPIILMPSAIFGNQEYNNEPPPDAPPSDIKYAVRFSNDAVWYQKNGDAGWYEMDYQAFALTYYFHPMDLAPMRQEPSFLPFSSPEYDITGTVSAALGSNTTKQAKVILAMPPGGTHAALAGYKDINGATGTVYDFNGKVYFDWWNYPAFASNDYFDIQLSMGGAAIGSESANNDKPTQQERIDQQSHYEMTLGAHNAIVMNVHDQAAGINSQLAGWMLVNKANPVGGYCGSYTNANGVAAPRNCDWAIDLAKVVYEQPTTAMTNPTAPTQQGGGATTQLTSCSPSDPNRQNSLPYMLQHPGTSINCVTTNFDLKDPTNLFAVDLGLTFTRTLQIGFSITGMAVRLDRRGPVYMFASKLDSSGTDPTDIPASPTGQITPDPNNGQDYQYSWNIFDPQTGSNVNFAQFRNTTDECTAKNFVDYAQGLKNYEFYHNRDDGFLVFMNNQATPTYIEVWPMEYSQANTVSFVCSSQLPMTLVAPSNTVIPIRGYNNIRPKAY